MINILMSGCNGRMGQVISSSVKERDDVTITCGVDIFDGLKNDYIVYPDFSNIAEPVDVIIDFSNPEQGCNIAFLCGVTVHERRSPSISL